MPEPLWDISTFVKMLSGWSGWVRLLVEECIQLPGGSFKKNYIQRESFEECVGIGAWNYILSVSSILACGNVKSSPSLLLLCCLWLSIPPWGHGPSGFWQEVRGVSLYVSSVSESLPGGMDIEKMPAQIVTLIALTLEISSLLIIFSKAHTCVLREKGMFLWR